MVGARRCVDPWLSSVARGGERNLTEEFLSEVSVTRAAGSLQADRSGPLPFLRVWPLIVLQSRHDAKGNTAPRTAC